MWVDGLKWMTYCMWMMPGTGPGGRVGGSAAPIEWRKGVLLGTGSFGKVYRGLNTTTGACA